MKEVTTVLTVMDRIEYLNSQLLAIEDQTISSDLIIHWNTNSVYRYKYPVFIYSNQHKSAPLYNRFISSLNISTPYIFICDDDILPGRKYLERCIEFSKQKNDKVCIVNYGMIFNENESEYKVNQRIGHDIFLNKPKLVNMGGQGYFFPTSLLREYCKTEIHDDKYGEDIHLGFVCWKYNIPIYVLDKNKNDKETWQDKTEGKRGVDEVAQWKYPTHLPVRNKLIKIYSDLGWDFKLDKTPI